MLNSVVKISVISAKYFEYYTIILRGPFFRGHTVQRNRLLPLHVWYIPVVYLTNQKMLNTSTK